MRVLLLLLAAAAALPAPEPAPQTVPGEFVQAVEFPYYLYPRQLWERELVWLKTIGIRTVEFNIPWNWHQPDGGDCDFTGRTSPRRDLMGFIRLLRRLEMRAWIRPLPPVKGWMDAGYPAGVAPERKSARPWLDELQRLLAPQTVKHGGPIAFVEGAAILDTPPPPQPVTVASAQDAAVMLRARQAVAGARGSLLWEDVEDAFFPAGWERPGGPIFRAGGVALNGDERPALAALRRYAALLHDWGWLLPAMKPLGGHPVRSANGKLPPGVIAAELVSRSPAVASAVTIANESRRPFRGALRAWDPFQKHAVEIDDVVVAPRDALWLPFNVALGSDGLCRDCSAFSNAERLVYATAELLSIGFENGVLSMEFSAPTPAHAVVQLARRPSGPYLAGGHPIDFDFDEKTLRVRLPIPQGTGPASHVRIGLAIEPPDTSAFFVEAKRLIIGRPNILSTSYSSEDLASRSRLRLPDGFTATANRKSPLEIDYSLAVPAEASHGDFANLAIEADGVALGRTRLQLFRPASVRFADAIRLHFGAAELPVDPPIIPIDAASGRSVEVSVRNNSPGIETYHIEPAAEGFDFLPPKQDLDSGALMDRSVSFRVFPGGSTPGLHDWLLRFSGGTILEMPARFLVIPRTGAIAWSADLDGDGSPEWVLENQRVRAVFSTQDGGRWLEFVWKDSNLNVLPEEGDLAGTGPVEARADGNALVLSGKGWTRTIRLADSEARLTIEQTTNLPAEALESGTHNEVTLQVARESARHAVYSITK